MPYEPHSYSYEKHAANAAHRERLYWLTLVSGATNLIVLVLYVIGAMDGLLAPLIGAMCGSLIAAAIWNRQDDYYNALVTAGFRWMSAALGTVLLLLWMHGATSLIDRPLPGFERFAGDIYLLALTLALMFHAGYSFAYLFDKLRPGENDLAV
ncbi:MAG: hypothetical protein WBA68_01040 [Alteraurantiacibacter sp.]